VTAGAFSSNARFFRQDLARGWESFAEARSGVWRFINSPSIYPAALHRIGSRILGRFGSADDGFSSDEGSVTSEPGGRGVTDSSLFLSMPARKQISPMASSSVATNSLGRSADDPKHF
jgi:hypothetical protein